MASDREIWRGEVLTEAEPADFAEATTSEEETRPAHKGRKAALIGGLIGALLVGTGVGYALTRGSSAPPIAKSQPPGTSEVTRQDLVNTQQEPGTLGYAGSYTVVGQTPPPSSGGGSGGGTPGGSGSGSGAGSGGGSGGGSPSGGSGTITWLPATGATITQGQQLYGVDGHAVPLLYGSTPLYRALSTGVSNGPDVRELNQDLRALGYHSAPTGDAFTSGTTDAVKAWQKALGVAKTGTVNPGDAVIEPGSVVVNTVTANLGGSASGSLMTLSGTTKVITVNLPVTAENLATVGESVQIQLPDNSTTPGHVTAIGTVATTPNNNNNGSGGGSGGPGGGNGDATVPVTVSLDNPQSVGSLTGAPVQVNFTSAEHANVLAVPVGALLALAEGGYAVDVVDPNGHTHLVAVTLGMFANGQVEVSGPDVHEGMKVEVAGTE
ncbi:MAG TPA: peptidoglycan-binding protein [Pseudonocardiaceae bacterium]|nr:peptidoglycan-binding protein [Pseudonocardiaceae bacterium]